LTNKLLSLNYEEDEQMTNPPSKIPQEKKCLKLQLIQKQKNKLSVRKGQAGGTG